MQKLIGLYSPAPQSGKSTVAKWLCEEKGYVVVPFAQTLKEALIPVLVALGHAPAEAETLVFRDKHTIIPEVKLSVRQLLQTLGTEWGRQCVHPDLWLKCWAKRIEQYDKVVVDDVRFENEASLVKRLGGELWLLQRPGIQALSGHASEGGLDAYAGFDRVIGNTGTIAELLRTLEEAVEA
jgi:hypothetical protein